MFLLHSQYVRFNNVKMNFSYNILHVPSPVTRNLQSEKEKS
jgi:hypothetical protein